MEHKFKIGTIVRTKTGKLYRITELTETGYRGRPVLETKPVCDSCLDAAKEESLGFGLSPAYVARNMGSEIPDHVCDARDASKECGCRCNQN